MTLPTDAAERKALPLATGVLEEKACPRCGDTKAISEFHASNRRAGARVGDGTFVQSACKACQSADKAKARERNRDFLAAAKLESGCVDCGYREHAFALDFHHVGPKAFGLGSRYAAQAPVHKLEAEMAKCVVLCAICHRVRHYKEGRL